MKNTYGPRTDFGAMVHAMKYRAPEESFDDYCVRYARATTDTDREFYKLVRLLREQIVLPAGRQQIAVGRPHQITAFNCMSGDTEIFTDMGWRRLDNVGEAHVLSPVSGTFEQAQVKSYGRQTLNEITVSNTFRDDRRSGHFTVRATANHRWVLQDNTISEYLKVGDVLKAASSDIEHEVAGWVHGFVYGDGTKCRDEVEGKPRSNPRYAAEYAMKKFGIRLCGRKAIYLANFIASDMAARATYPPSNDGDPWVVCFSKRELKKLPDKLENPAYLAGFVRGLLDADGCFSSRGNDAFQFHGTEASVKWVRDHLVLANYAPLGSAKEVGGDATDYGPRTEPLWCQLFRPTVTHMGFKVLAIQPKEEAEVYCVEEPKYRQFVLRNGLRTGNCFVGDTIKDDTRSIFQAVEDAAITLRSGGGCGWDFSTIRPDGELVRGLGLGAKASGPVSFMHVWNAMCGTIMSAGERRGAMMGVLRCDHPDILKFVKAKMTAGTLTNFNISVAATDEFMEAVDQDGLYTLRFGDRTYGQVRARDVWGPIMDGSWDNGEPGVLFLDTINRRNPLSYCETINATNPCAEQPLPPNGACLLGSVNVLKLLVPQRTGSLAEVGSRKYDIDYDLLAEAVGAMVRAFDNVIDRTTYPLDEQMKEAKAKRRMGIGVTAVANALETMGKPYGSPSYLAEQSRILHTVMMASYRASLALAQEKGPFQLWDAERYCAGEFYKELPDDLQVMIRRHGLRNGLLTSIAPTGTISLTADNVSSGIEPVFQERYNRIIKTPDGEREFEIIDAGFNQYGTKPKPAHEVTPAEHVSVLCEAQRYVDSSISKTINVAGQVGGEGPGTTFSEFRDVYMECFKRGAKGCTTFNSNGKRAGILRPADVNDDIGTGVACVFDPATGIKECG